MTVIGSTPAPTNMSQSDLAPSIQPPTPPVPPEIPDVPAPTAAQPTAVQLPGTEAIIPLSRQQLDALAKRRDVLSSHLGSVQRRRDDVAKELENASEPTNRTGLEERLRFLDDRILSLEQEINDNSAARASLEANYSATSAEGGSESSSSDQYDGLIAFFVLFPISLAVARAIWRRTSRRSIQAAIPQTEARFAQLEQSIDAVAVEIERVAEGQRYVTRLLREGQPIPDFSSDQAADPVRSRANSEHSR